MSRSGSASCGLYAGADLENAARRSTNLGSGAKFDGLTNAASMLLNTAAQSIKKRSQPALSAVTAQVRIQGSTETMTVVYVGRGSNRGWFLSGIFETVTESASTLPTAPGGLSDTIEKIATGANILFVEDISAAALASLPFDFLRMPAWIKQRVFVCADWHDQITDMRRTTRRAIARFLRKYGYVCEITHDHAEFEHFYDELYEPYITSRHGDEAEIVPRDFFLNECTKGALIQLKIKDDIVGASLAKPMGSAMAVVWTGLQADCNGRPQHGASEVLDYFCLLYSHIQGFRWFDLGPSRPDLNNGTFRYKARWNAVVHLGFAKPREIHWAFTKTHAALPELLRRHAFTALSEKGLTATVVTDGTVATTTELRSLLKRYAQPGIDNYRIIALGHRPRVAPDTNIALVPRVTLKWASNTQELVTQYVSAGPAA